MGTRDFMFPKMLHIITDYNVCPQCIMLYIGPSTKAGWNRKDVGEWICIIVIGYNHKNASHSKITDGGQVDVLILSQSWGWTSNHLTFIEAMKLKLTLVVFSLYDSRDTLNLLTNAASMFVLIWVGCYTTFQGTALRMCTSHIVVFEECLFKLTPIAVVQNGNVPVSHSFNFK